MLIGPSHFIEFEGVAASRADAFETPFGPVAVDGASVAALAAASTLVCEHEAAHAREHSIEMQLPFLCRVRPNVPIVPLLMGHQTAETALELGRVLAETFVDRRAMFIASADLSHHCDVLTAAALDRRTDHACGGGALVAVMRAARLLGATRAQILRYGDSGDVSGDKSSVVGYLSAAFRRVSLGERAPHAT